MKKIITLFLCFLLLFTLLPIGLLAQSVDAPAQEEPVAQEEEIPPERVRDQNILVPTAKGVQKANQIEANLIHKYEEKTTNELCESYLLGDYESQEILEAYNIDSIRAMASTSKIVSIFVVLDKIQDGTISKTDMVSIDHESAMQPGSSYELKEGMEVSVDDLIKASMVVSGNDAITALAKYVSGSVDHFVYLMNEKCKDLGLKNAHMINPTGLTNYEMEDYNKMTTREMFILSCKLLEAHPEIIKYTNLPSLQVESRNYLEYNTNPILGILPEIDGLKTGYTNAAGRCVITTGLKKGIDNQSKDLRLIGVITGCRGDWQRYVVAKRLMGEGLEKYTYTVLGNPEEALMDIEVENSAEPKVKVYEKERSYTLWNGVDEIHSEIKLQDNLKAPLEEGTVVGHVDYYLDGNVVHSTDLINHEKVHERGILSKILRIYEDIFKNIDRAA